MKLDGIEYTLEDTIRRLGAMVESTMLDAEIDPEAAEKKEKPKAKKLETFPTGFRLEPKSKRIQWNGSPFEVVKAAIDPKHKHHHIILEDARSQLLGTFNGLIQKEKAKEIKLAKEKETNEVTDFFAALDSL